MRRSILAAVLILLVAALGCEPSTSSDITGPSVGSATIFGTIINTGNTTNGGSAGASVRATGTNFTTTVDSTQTFTLAGVRPSSNVVLEFMGAGLNSEVAIGPVLNGDQVNIVLVRTNGVVELDHTGRRAADGTQVEGRIDSIAPLGRSMQVIDQTIQTDASTQFFLSSGLEGAFEDLAVGLRAQISGISTAPGMLLAKSVRLLEPAPETTVQLSGQISNLEGPSINFQFSLQGRLIRGDSGTTFSAGTTFANISNGSTVDVTGLTRVGFIYATRIQLRLDIGRQARARDRDALNRHSSTSLEVMRPW